MIDTSLTMSQRTHSPTTSASQACYQNLPQHIIERIIQHLSRTSVSDGYLCDLRSVNHQTNEAVLHYLAFMGGQPMIYFEHCMSCTDICRRPLCREAVTCNEFYSRFHLQGRIAVRYDEDPNRQKYYAALGQALAILEDDLASPLNLFTATRSYLDDSNKAICSSRNPVFTNKLSIILCDAMVEYSKMLNDRHSYASWRNHNIYHKRSTKFWLRSLACYLGDIDLLKHYSVSEKFTGVIFTYDLEELGELLGMAARRGHEIIFEHLFADAPKDSIDFRFALCGACQSVSVNIVQTIFEAVPVANLPHLCLRGLLQVRESQRMPCGYPEIAQLLLNKVNPGNRLSPNLRDTGPWQKLMWSQASLDATDQVRYLLERYSSLVSYPFHPIMGCSMSALWSACMNGNIECVEVLLNAKYFRRQEDIPELCGSCRIVAMRSNSLLIYEKLSSFMGSSIDVAPFEHLAGMDGTISLMVRRLDAKPKLLEAQVKDWAQPQSGQMALIYAAKLLRVANVQFLLERGVRLDEAFLREYDSRHTGRLEFQIEWRYRRAHELKYQQVRQLLQDYGVRMLDVEL